jgi:hypothetical protein
MLASNVSRATGRLLFFRTAFLPSSAANLTVRAWERQICSEKHVICNAKLSVVSATLNIVWILRRDD